MKNFTSKYKLKLAAKEAKYAPSGGRPASYFRHCPKVSKGLGRFFGSWWNVVNSYNRLENSAIWRLKHLKPPKEAVALQHFSRERRNGLKSLVPNIGFAAGALSILLISALLFLMPASPASASGLGIAPLKYQTDLNGKLEKGAVDITNLSAFTQNVTIQIQAFRQIDGKGTLQFYTDPLISAGITPDYQHFQLAPQERIHLYFLLDGKKLPKKRIFAALLAQAQPVKGGYNITPVLRVGTLLILKNGNGDPPKQGRITGWHMSLFQFGNGVSGNFNFINTEAGQDASGYFPSFKVLLAGTSQSFSGDLVFPGISRPQSFNLPGARIGVYKLKLTSDANTGVSQWVVVLTGFWRWLLPLLIIIAVGLIILALRLKGSRKFRR